MVSLGVVANDRWSKREAGADVVARVGEVRSLVALQQALYNERAAVEIELRSELFGVPSTLGAVLLGVADAEDTFDATNAAMEASPSAPSELGQLLAVARESRTTAGIAAIEAYDVVDDAIVVQFGVELAAMQELGVGTAEGKLSVVLSQLEVAVQAFSASTEQTTSLANAWFAAEQDRGSALSALGFQTARYQLALDSLDQSKLSEQSGDELAQSEGFVLAAVVQVLAGEVTAPEDNEVEFDEALPFIISVFSASFTRNDVLSEVLVLAADDVEATATRVAADASNAFVAALVIGSVAVGLSLLLSWSLARSIASPMASVAARTRQLQAGQIEARPLEMTGPRELRDVASAINDVSVNLDALEGKLGALARADLGDHRLSEPLPGRLGDTLTKSVDTLSASIADRHALHARLGYQASHDDLTGLFNRAAFLAHLDSVLEKAAVAPVGLLFVDLDDFKRANDVFGHATGDEVLVEVAHRLRETCRPTDMVARLGGDEFLVVTEQLDGIDGLLRMARRIIDVVGAPMPLESVGGLSIAPSVGIARTADPTTKSLALLSEADAALYLAKSNDTRIGIFDERLQSKLSRKSQIEQQLHVALSTEQFEVHYQPVLRADSLGVGQLEALVRWVGEDAYGPDDFVPVAEQSDLVIALDRLVLRTATRDLVDLLADSDRADLRMAVNLSGRHLLHANVVAHVAEALTMSQLDPSRLIIEVTETALIADLDRAAEHLRALRDLGVRVSVDDFGTGFTSITQLRRLPIDEIKIDRSLVAELPGEQALVRVVRDLAQHFGMSIVAEGVETEDQATFLRTLGCTYLQGWLYARAMPMAELGPWFTARNENTAPDRVVTAVLP